MAIGLQSATGAASAADPHTVVTSESPSATQVGDLVVVVDANDYYALSNMGTPSATGTPTMNAITGATLDLGSPNGHIKGWWYVANTGGAQTISVDETGSADEEKVCVAFVLSGADTTSPVDAAATTNGAATTSPLAPSVSPATSDAFLLTVVLAIGGHTTADPYTTPGPLTERGETTTVMSSVFATAQLAASGATGTFTFTSSASVVYGSVSIAIKTGAAVDDMSPVLSPTPSPRY